MKGEFVSLFFFGGLVTADSKPLRSILVEIAFVLAATWLLSTQSLAGEATLAPYIYIPE